MLKISLNFHNNNIMSFIIKKLFEYTSKNGMGIANNYSFIQSNNE